MKESRLQRQIRSDLERVIGGVWVKIHGGQFQEPGIGDLMGCVRGLHIELEVKTEKGKPTKTQLLRQRRINKEDGCYAFITSSKQAIDIVLGWLITNGKITSNEATRIPSRWRKLCAQKKNRVLVHGHKNGKNAYYLPRIGKAVAKRIS